MTIVGGLPDFQASSTDDDLLPDFRTSATTSRRRSSHPESPGRTASTRASTASSATSASALSGFVHAPKPASSSKRFDGDTTRSGRTRASPTRLPLHFGGQTRTPYPRACVSGNGWSEERTRPGEHLRLSRRRFCVSPTASSAAGAARGRPARSFRSMRISTSVNHVVGFTSCMAHIVVMVWMTASRCPASREPTQTNLFRPIATRRSRRSASLLSSASAGSLSGAISVGHCFVAYPIALPSGDLGRTSVCSRIHRARHSIIGRMRSWWIFACSGVPRASAARTSAS